jgi:hypothetical protein
MFAVLVFFTLFTAFIFFLYDIYDIRFRFFNRFDSLLMSYQNRSLLLKLVKSETCGKVQSQPNFVFIHIGIFIAFVRSQLLQILESLLEGFFWIKTLEKFMRISMEEVAYFKEKVSVHAII